MLTSDKNQVHYATLLRVQTMNDGTHKRLNFLFSFFIYLFRGLLLELPTDTTRST